MEMAYIFFEIWGRNRGEPETTFILLSDEHATFAITNAYALWAAIDLVRSMVVCSSGVDTSDAERKVFPIRRDVSQKESWSDV